MKPKPGFALDYAHPLSRGLVGWWVFNEGSGSVASDYSGGRHHGTLLNGTTWGGGVHGQSLLFDGVNDIVSVTDATIFSFNGGSPDFPFSVAARIFLNAAPPPGGANILSKWGGTAATREWRFEIASGGGAGLHITDTSGNRDARFSSVLAQNRWYHVLATYNGNGEFTDINIYVDGVLDNSTSSNQAYSGMSNTTADIVIGNVGSVESVFAFPGFIDDVRIYNLELVALQANQIFSQPYANVLQPGVSSSFVPVSNVRREMNTYRRRRVA